MPKLIITLIKCNGLKKADVQGLSDPYVVFRYADEERKSSMIKNTLDPKYDESFQYVIRDLSKSLEIVVWDWNRFTKDEEIGTAVLKLKKLERNEKEKFKLDLDPKGTITMEVVLTDMSCEHVSYQKCEIMGTCCSLYFGCVKCHKKHYREIKEKHPKFTKIRQVRCTNCFMEQPFREKCVSCDSLFCKYSCVRCNEYYDKAMKHCYICDDCVSHPRSHEHFPFICRTSKLWKYVHNDLEVEILDAEKYEQFFDKYPRFEKNIDLIAVFFRQTLVRACISQCYMIERMIKDSEEELYTDYELEVTKLQSVVMRIKNECTTVLKENKNVRRRDLYFMKIRMLMKVKMINSFKKYTIKQSVMPNLKISDQSIRKEIRNRQNRKTISQSSQSFRSQSFLLSLKWDGWSGQFMKELVGEPKEEIKKIQDFIKVLKESKSTVDFFKNGGKIRETMTTLLIDDFGQYFKNTQVIERDSFYNRKDVQFIGLIFQIFLGKEFRGFRDLRKDDVEKKERRLQKLIQFLVSIYENFRSKILEEEKKRRKLIEEEEEKKKSLSKKISSNKLISSLTRKKSSSKKKKNTTTTKNKKKKKIDTEEKKKKGKLKHKVSSFLKSHGLPHRLKKKKEEEKKSKNNKKKKKKKEDPKKKKKKKKKKREEDDDDDDSEKEEESDDEREKRRKRKKKKKKKKKKKREEDDDSDGDDEDDDNDSEEERKKKRKKKNKKKKREEEESNDDDDDDSEEKEEEEKKKESSESDSEEQEEKEKKRKKKKNDDTKNDPEDEEEEDVVLETSADLIANITTQEAKIKMGSESLPITPLQFFSTQEEEEEEVKKKEKSDDDDDDNSNSSSEEKKKRKKKKEQQEEEEEKKKKKVISQVFQLDSVDLYLILIRVYISNFRINKSFVESMYRQIKEFRAQVHNIQKHEPKYSHIIGLKELADKISFNLHDPLVHIFRTTFDNIELVFRCMYIFEKSIYSRVLPKSGKKRQNAGIRDFVLGIVKNLDLFEFIVKLEHEERKMELANEESLKMGFGQQQQQSIEEIEGESSVEEEEEKEKEVKKKEEPNKLDPKLQKELEDFRNMDPMDMNTTQMNRHNKLERMAKGIFLEDDDDDDEEEEDGSKKKKSKYGYDDSDSSDPPPKKEKKKKKIKIKKKKIDKKRMQQWKNQNLDVSVRFQKEMKIHKTLRESGKRTIRKSILVRKDNEQWISSEDFPVFCTQALFVFDQTKNYVEALTDKSREVKISKLFKSFFKINFAKIFAKGFVKRFLRYVDLFFRSIQKNKELAELGLFQTVIPLLIDLNKFVDFGEHSNFYEILAPAIKHAIDINLSEQLEKWTYRAIQMEDFIPIDPKGDVLHSSYCKDVIEFVFHPIEIIYTVDVLTREGEEIRKSFMFNYFPVMADTLTTYVVATSELIENELQKNLEHKHSTEKKKERQGMFVFKFAKNFGSVAEDGKSPFSSIGDQFRSGVSVTVKGVDVKKLCLLSSNVQGCLDYLINVLSGEEFEDVLFNSLYLDQKTENQQVMDDEEAPDDDDDSENEGESDYSDDDIDSEEEKEKEERKKRLTEIAEKRKKKAEENKKLGIEEEEKLEEEIPKNIFEVPEIKRLMKELTDIRNQVAGLFAQFVYLENYQTLHKLILSERPDKLMKEFQDSMNERLSMLSPLLYYEIFRTIIRSLWIILVNECIDVVFRGNKNVNITQKKSTFSFFGGGGGSSSSKLNNLAMEERLVKNVRYFVHTISMLFRSGGCKKATIQHHQNRLNEVIALHYKTTKELKEQYENCKKNKDKRESFYALRMLMKKGSKKEKRFAQKVLPKEIKSLSFKQLVKEQFSVGKGGGKKKDLQGIKKLFVTLKNGSGLPIKDKGSKSSDPYCVIRFGKTQKKFSKVVYKRLNPQWNEEFVFAYNEFEFTNSTIRATRGGKLLNYQNDRNDVEDSADIKILFKVYDRDHWKRDDLIGERWVSLDDLEMGKKVTKRFKIYNRRKGQKKSKNKFLMGLTKELNQVKSKAQGLAKDLSKEMKIDKVKEKVEGLGRDITKEVNQVKEKAKVLAKDITNEVKNLDKLNVLKTNEKDPDATSESSDDEKEEEKGDKSSLVSVRERKEEEDVKEEEKKKEEEEEEEEDEGQLAVEFLLTSVQ